MAIIVITCPECDKQIKVPADKVGKKIRCKNCEHVFVIKPPPAGDAIAAAKTKPPAAPAKKEGKPAKPARPADDDEDEVAGKGYDLGDIDETLRCPQCAAKMANEQAIICLNCGYNRVTREIVRTRKIKEVTGSDKFMWLLPGIACVLTVLLIIGYCFFHHFALPGILIDNWDALTATKGRLEALKDDSVEWWQAALCHPAIEVWIFVFLAFGAWKAGRFAYKRLVVNHEPPEVEEET